MKSDNLLIKLDEELEVASKNIDLAKKQKAESKNNIKAAKKVTNVALIEKCKTNLEVTLEKPALCKEEVKKYKANLRNVMSSKDKSMEKIEYAKQEVKDAKTRLTTAKKEVREARKALMYAKHVGDSDVIVKEQDKLNNIKLDILRENLVCDRVVCDTKTYIAEQNNIIKQNESLVKTNDENAINQTKEAKEKIAMARSIANKARRILPKTNLLRKFYSEHQQSFEAFILLLPAFLILGLFMIFPLVNTFVMSFMKNFTFEPGGGILAFNHQFDGIGFSEYLNILRHPTFIRALQNTTIMVIISVPLTVIIALLISVALNGVKKLQGTYQTIFFLPYVTNTIALGMVFKVLFDDTGLINAIFGTNTTWLTDATPAGYWKSLVVITVYTIWNGLAFKILIFLSGLQSIDKQYYDAALIDGASRGRIFRKITVPLLSPMILYTVITSFIGAFKAYSNVIAVFGRGPHSFGPAGAEDMWITVVGFIYENMQELLNPGSLSTAAAGSVILLVIILLITVVQFVVSKKRVHY